jgi:Ca2+-transporting ATPase
VAVIRDSPSNAKAKHGRETLKGAAGRSRAATEIMQSIEFSVVHHGVPGRLRLKAQGLFRRPELSKELETRLRRISVISSVEVSSLTGTALLKFEPNTSHADVLKLVAGALARSGAKCGQSSGRVRRRSTVSRRASSQPPSTKQSKPTNRSRARRPVDPRPMIGYPSPLGASSSDWHAKTAEAALRELGVDAVRGLSSEDAARRLDAFGRNETAERPPTSAFALIARQMTSLPVGMLLGASVVSLLTGGIVDALITLGVVVVNAGIGYGTESGSERIIRSMTQRQPLAVPVVRDSKERMVDHACLVPGDLLLLRPSTVVAADARLIDGDGLMTSEALLTGESEPVEKSCGQLHAQSEALAGRSNMVHKGSFVVSGSGRAVVVTTGAATETGRIEAAAHEISTPRTPLERDLDNLGSKLALASLVVCGAFFAAGYLRGRSLLSMFNSAIALAVAAVPEGLPATATTTLALGLRDLRRKGVIVRRLEAVEGLGSLQVICFDKTGTLTQNRMQLEQVHVGTKGLVVDAATCDRSTACAPALRRLLEIATLCSEVTFEEIPEGVRAIGSATEAALATKAIEFGVDPIALRTSLPLLRMQFRNEQRRYMASFHEVRCEASGPPEGLLAVKGDPQQVLGLCNWALDDNGELKKLGEDDRRGIAARNNDLAGRGLRVLGFAFAEGQYRSLEGASLVWAGAAGLKDPVGHGVKELVARLHKAGIRPVMITGDQAATAEAIAREIGLSGTEPLRVLDSTALDRLPAHVLAAVAQRTHVFARVPPTKKLHLVHALQSAGLTVGMSGDGFNDAPALKAANIAIAVGVNSATAARDVADVIIANDDLGVIADGIEQGRTILSNIRKSVHYMISTNLSEILVLMAETINRNDVLESPMELLWLNLVTDVLPGLGLALEPAERFVMSSPPRSADDPLLSTTDLRHAAVESGILAGAVLGAHGYGLLRYGPGQQTRTVTFLSLVAAQLMHALTCRHDRFVPLGGRSLFGNPVLNAALLGSTVLQVLPFAIPGLRRLIGVSAPRGADLVVAGAAGLTAFAANEALLAYRSRSGQHR